VVVGHLCPCPAEVGRHVDAVENGRRPSQVEAQPERIRQARNVETLDLLGVEQLDVLDLGVDVAVVLVRTARGAQATRPIRSGAANPGAASRWNEPGIPVAELYSPLAGDCGLPSKVAAAPARHPTAASTAPPG
jgi:hypothetical protein